MLYDHECGAEDEAEICKRCGASALYCDGLKNCGNCGEDMNCDGGELCPRCSQQKAIDDDPDPYWGPM